MPIKVKIYTFLCVLFTVLTVSGNLIYRKIVFLNFPFYTFNVPIGALLYPATFFITDLIAEFYGTKDAKFCVRTSVCINMVMSLLISGMKQLKATPWSIINDSTFDLVFGFFGIAFIGSMIATYISQSIDIVIYMGIRKLTGVNKFLWLRNAGSTAVSLLIDTSIVMTFLCIVGAMPKEKIFHLILNSYSLKLVFTVCGVPLFYLSVFIIRKVIGRTTQY